MAVNAATDRPLLEGAGMAALAGGVAGGVTGLTLGLASPASAAIVAHEVGIGIVGIGAAIPAVGGAVDKVKRLADKFGTTAGQLADDVLQNGTAYLDKASGNVNHLLARPDGGAGLIRVTTDAAGKRIVSAGWQSAAGLAKGVADGRFVPK